MDDVRRETAIAVAPMMPMPGMVLSRWLAWFERCCILIRFSIAPITDREQFLHPGVAFAATMPSSARCARRALGSVLNRDSNAS